MPERKPDYDRELNAQQRAAVFHKDGPALVIAGAGTGKTRTLVYRVAHLIERGIDPRRILLLTFTRRAAKEMLERAATLVDDQRARIIAGGTFHSFAHTVLRRHGHVIGLAKNFTVLDRSDNEDIIQHLRTELGFAGKRGEVMKRRFPQKRALSEMRSKALNRQVSLQKVLQRDWPQFLEDHDRIATLLDRYERYKKERRLCDYDDLLIQLLALFTTHPFVAERFAERFQRVLIDEYQDTNKLQSDILRSFVLHRNIMAVGDDAQSIYSFRGADFRNIMAFPKTFPRAAVYRIEENYRSTQPVLDAANAVIEKADERYEKRLFASQRVSGISPRLVGCADEAAQAGFVADEILRLREEGIALEESAVLFRSSYHSFELEAELLRRNIPFVKYGGFKFAEAAHVKDAMAHLRWIVNHKDLVAAQRCLLVVDGIGPVAARAIAEQAASAAELSSAFHDVAISGKTQGVFSRLVEALRDAERVQGPAAQLEALLPYLEETLVKRFDDFPKRVRDLQHLANMARRFRSTDRFVSDFSIEPPADHTVTGVSGVENEEGPLVLSTIHSAKGLEWRAVFIISVLDGYLPQDYAFRSAAELEEERRLLYVAMTRAKEFLTLSYPAMIAPGGAGATIRSEMVFAKPSHFLEGIEEQILPHTVVADAMLFDGIRYEDDGF